MSTWIRTFVLGVALLAAASARADIASGDARLFIDTDLVNFEHTRSERVGEREFETQLDLGPGGSAITASLPGVVGLGVGYALHKHIVTALHFSFARHQSTHERYFDGAVQPSLYEPTVTSFMLRPELELVLNPKGVAVAGLLLGLDLRLWNERTRPTARDEGSERRAVAFGPAAGFVTHLFVVRDASVDLAALAVVDFVDTKGDDPWSDAARYVNVGASLTLGLSLWP